jgi:hypothetical protein
MDFSAAASVTDSDEASLFMPTVAVAAATSVNPHYRRAGSLSTLPNGASSSQPTITNNIQSDVPQPSSLGPHPHLLARAKSQPASQMMMGQRATRSQSLSQHREVDDINEFGHGHGNDGQDDDDVQIEPSMLPQRSYDWSADSSDGVVRMS